jgi:hypothetical protein
MGFAASLFDETGDENEFWKAWSSLRRGERRILRKRLSLETRKRLQAKGSAASVRKELASWVKANIIRKPTRRGTGRRGK